jgi:hypothetical protein
MRNSWKTPVASLVLAVLALGAAGPAWSQSSAGADAAQQADEHFRQAKVLFKAGKKREAREEYLAAFRLKQSHDVAGNLGNVELSLGMARDAAEHLSFAIRHYAPTGSTPEQIEKARLRLAEAKRQVGTVAVSVNVPGAEVLVDGVSVGRAPIEGELFVEPGKRTVSARLAGYEEARQAIDAGGGTDHQVALVLVGVVTAPVVTKPPSVAPAAPTVLGPGLQRRPVWPAIVGGALAAGGLGAGLGLTTAASGKRADAEALRTKLGTAAAACGGVTAAGAATSCQTIASDTARHDTLNRAALGSFIVGGALALASAGFGAWAALGPKDDRGTQTSVRALPLVSRDEGGIVVVGTW